jgi:serpin B
VTVSDALRVRSQPRVADDSVRYDPLLPLGTNLEVLAGPVDASGYRWYEVAPIGVHLQGGPGTGWVASAAKTGEPWIAPAGGPLADVGVEHADTPRLTGSPAGARHAGAALTTFGVDLQRALLAAGDIEPDANAVFSPASIAMALALARSGARGQTATEMDEVLRSDPWDAFRGDLAALDAALASRNASWAERSQDENGAPVTVRRDLVLQLANAAFGQRDWTVRHEYLDDIAAMLGASLHLADFANRVEDARHAINAWVAARTADRIPELLGQGMVSTATRLVLVNAIYLKANWEVEFDPDSTTSDSFTRPDGTTTRVATMHRDLGQLGPYARGNGWQATELRYRGQPATGGIDAAPTAPLAMTLILPDDLRTFERGVTADQLARIIDVLDSERDHLQEVTPPADDNCGSYPYSVSLSLPRFSMESRLDLGPVLQSLGMRAAFDAASADFTGIRPADAGEQVHIGRVIHQANIQVDEKGTEAAAATAIVLDTGGCTGPMPERTVTLRFNRPFLFLLRDIETGAVLFMGRVTAPAA